MQDDLDSTVRDKRRKDSEQFKREQLRAERKDFELLVSEAWGRRIVHRMLVNAGVWRTSFTENPHVTAYNEGRRNAGLELLAELAPFPDAYALMLKENSDGT